MEKQDKKIKRQKNKKLSSFATIGLGKEKDYFVENLAILLTSGMGILDALEAIKTETRSRRMRKIVQKIEDDIDAGSPLWRVLENTNLVKVNTISLIKIGEESGKLPENLKVIAIQRQKDRTFSSRLRSAMIYPILILSVTVIVGIGISWFILPRLSTVFLQLKVDLPVITKILINFGSFLGKYGMIFVPSFIFAFFLIIYFIFVFPVTKSLGQWLLLKLPGIKKLIQEVEIARFGYALGTLLDAGLPIIVALDSLHEVATFNSYKKLYAHLKSSIEEGNSFQKSFKQYRRTNKLIPFTIQQMVVAGEQSGQLSETLLKVGEIFEEKTETTTKNLTVVLEPILLIFVWLGVVVVALAIILPIYSLIGGLNNATNTTSYNTSTQTKQEKPNTQGSEANNQQKKESLPKLEITSTSEVDVYEDPESENKISIGKALPGKTYEYQNQKENWYEIILDDNKSGWVESKYVKLLK